MDLFKNIKELNGYKKELSVFLEAIKKEKLKIKIGKYKIIETPSEIAATRLHEKLRSAVEGELIEVTNICTRIEKTINKIQTDLFKDIEPEEQET